LKAKTDDWQHAIGCATSVATESLGEIHQIDTYFHAVRGRLKLREISDGACELIWYNRANGYSPRISNFLLTPITDSESIIESLSSALGVRVVVEKFRQIFLYHNVRIHIDRVVNLGNFVEFEAVVGGEIDNNKAKEQVLWLQNEFAILDRDLLSTSYGDMLATRGGGGA